MQPITKRNHVTLVVAMALSNALFLLLAWYLSLVPNIEAMLPQYSASDVDLAYVGALVCLCGGTGRVYFGTKGRISFGPAKSLMSPAMFQGELIVGVAMAAACTAIGLRLFLRGAGLTIFAPFALAPMFIDLAFFLPCVLKYWSARDEERGAKLSF